MRRRKKKRKIGFISKTALAANLGFVVLLLLSYLASFVNPAAFWPIAFIGLGYPFLLGINFLFLIYWLLRKPVYALLPGLTILLGLKFLLSTIGFRESTAIEVPKSSQDMIRVMTWNVHNFKPFNPGNNDRAVRLQMLDIIRREQPDILCIQEYYSKKRGENNIKKAIQEILGSKHYYLYEDFENPWEVQGMAFFSKLPIKNHGVINFPNTVRGNEAVFADFEFNGKKFRVYNIHLQSIRFQPEDYEYIRNVKGINTNVESSRRIGGRLKRAFIKRSEQALLVKAHVRECKLPYVIAGDFNDTPASFAVNTLCRGNNNSFREKGSGFGITYNGDFPNFQIDYILSSRDFEVKSYLTIKKKLSDHYPLVSDLELK
ncbi:endonuclease/exonuclease/phosphatase family protein [Arcticibacter sp. MXS-1]|uniref:endonuclease/exonuclease/phosphatase family protein n=1 Tax=Arcticibacter sp. MXS-1 TaxID=3341726 RepID=UPI0035A856FD